MNLDKQAIAAGLMSDFMRSSGVCDSPDSARRYLWTDAFAVCNFLELMQETGERRYLEAAQALIRQVHDVLGRHRRDDLRRGWISGLDEPEGLKHPTSSGLRIGKPLPERNPGEPFYERLEWDRDGQYYHYLTKWMHALRCMAAAAQEGQYLLWAIELAAAAHNKFVYPVPGSGKKRMYWKMSIDLSRPLVPSMGQHDPLDGLITYRELAAAGRDMQHKAFLGTEIAELRSICEGGDWETSDPLGLGGLLCGVYRIARLEALYSIADHELFENVLESCTMGLEAFRANYRPDLSAPYRLAFRELGLAIGLQAVIELEELIQQTANLRRFAPGAAELRRYIPLQAAINEFWLKPANQEYESWTEHRDINAVMLATSLMPGTFLSA